MPFTSRITIDVKQTVCAVALIFMSSGMARAEDAARAFMERSVGQWHSTVMSGEEKSIGLTMSRWSSDKSGILGQEKVFGAELTEIWFGRSVKQLGEKPNTMKMHYAAEDGTQFEDQITFNQEGNVFKGSGKRRGFDGNGDTFTADVTVTSSDDNHMTWRIANGRFGGEERPDLILKFTRARHDDSGE
jgi:hypothetical protein